MKNTFLIMMGMLISFGVYSQSFNYKKAWEQVEQYQKERKPESAIKVLDEIEEAALKEDNGAQRLKVFGTMPGLIIQDSDVGETGHLNYLLTQIESFDSPEKQVGHLVVFNYLMQYYNQNHYLIQDRTTISDVLPEDIKEWAPENYESVLLSHLEKALTNYEDLWVPIEAYAPLLNEFNPRGELLRPYLLDVVAHHALDLLQNPLLSASDFQTTTNLAQYYIQLDSFLLLNIPATYSKEKILNVYQKILSAHLAKSNEEALLDADLHRVKYLNSLAIKSEKDSLFMLGIQILRESHNFTGARTIIDLEKANYLFSSSFQEGGEPRKREAYNMVMEILDRDAENVEATNLLNSIIQKKYHTTTKEVYTTDQKIKIKITSANIEKLNYTIVKINDEPKVFYRKNRDEIKQYLKSIEKKSSGELQIGKSENFEETNNDYEITNPGFGYYAIYFENEGSFYYNTFYVSNLAYVAKQKGSLDVVVASRISGEPIENAKVSFYLNVYDRTTRTNQFNLLETLNTDAQGKVSFSGQNLNGSLKLSVEKGKDKILLEDNYYIYNSPDFNESRQSEAFILTDRAIYRPGQTVHFKAILLGYNKNIPKIESMENVVISLMDANGTEVMNKQLRSNEYGSVASSFVLPSAGLTGSFSLTVSSGKFQGYKAIQVEEYRRPKFQVTLQKPSESFRLGDSIQIIGEAVSYTSVPVSDGKVSYQVFRRERRWWWDYYMPFSGEEILISSGITQTDEAGQFTIDFLGNGSSGQSYIFRIEADVLDLSGETRSAETEIVISDKQFNLFTEAISLLDIGDSTNLKYHVQNNAGEEISMPTSYQITILEDPGYIIDVNDNKYRLRAVNDIEAILKQWKGKGVVKSAYVNDTSRYIDLSGLKAGGYKIIVYAGDQTFSKYLAISDRKNQVYPFVQTLFVHAEKNEYQPGEKARFTFGTPFKNLNVYIEEERSDHSQTGRWVKISNQRIVDLPVTEMDYGGFGIKYWTILHNNIISENKVISVPWKNKKLEISYTTFRDNLIPGAEEKWIIKISGEDKDVIAAELIASMYDMSLDQYINQNWTRNFYPTFRFNDQWNSVGFNHINGRHLYYEWNQLKNLKISPVIYPYFTFLQQYGRDIMVRGRATDVMMNQMSDSMAPPKTEESGMNKISDEVEETSVEYGGDDAKDPEEIEVQIRQNLQETVFFMPQLHTDDQGNVIIEFKMGEALTKWKLMLFAHDKQFRFGFSEKEVITKKDLMVVPYAPRFVRQGDIINFTGKVSNLSDTSLVVDVKLKLFNALTRKDISTQLIKNEQSTKINMNSGVSHSVSFELEIDQSFTDPIEFQMIATAGNFSDGESGTLPVITNKIYVTETKAFTLSSGESFSYNIEELIKKGSPISLGFDYTAHPVWTVIQALPTLSDSPHESTEQILNKYFAQALGNKILTSIPNIDQILDQWMEPESTALMSNLEKNNEFKSTTLENTPWVLDARNETDQKRSLANFLDKNTLHYKKIQLLEKLKFSQNADGGFPWFTGGRSNTYITQYILENIARMRDLGLISIEENGLMQLQESAIQFIDEEAQHRYNELLKLEKEQKIKMEEDHLLPIDIHYLYTKKLYGDQKSGGEEFYTYYLNQAYKYWANKSDMSRALIAKIAHANKKEDIVDSIIQSFNERMLTHPELGAYWKQSSSYNWYQLPIETHTAILELYQEVDADNPLITDMQLWLLNHKRTNAWPTSKSTASAIYALLKSKDSNLSDWTNSSTPPVINVNNATWTGNSELATGYISENWKGSEVSEFRSIEVKNNNNNVAWGGLYIRYLTPIDAIEDHAQGSIAIEKSLFVKRSIDGVEKLIPVSNAKVEVGDMIVSRMVINTDRDMSFLHLKDMRASGLEPINVISNYKWKGGIGYYESTRDVATHFFIDYLPKGKYVFEHELRVSHSGEFSNGISTLQSMYAPEFSSHSASGELTIE